MFQEYVGKFLEFEKLLHQYRYPKVYMCGPGGKNDGEVLGCQPLNVELLRGGTDTVGNWLYLGL